MKYLLHCIFERGQEQPPLVPGISVVAAGGLAAAVSRVEETSPPPDVSSLLAYERSVEAIHARVAIVPLRYGCLMENESAIIRLLEDHHHEYETLLHRLEGMAEMGIRFLGPASPAFAPRSPQSPGAAYLASLRSRYGPQDLTAEEAELAAQILGLLSGCYNEQRKETSISGHVRLVSLYFLILKTQVERFRDRARQIRLARDTKLLLSGPWPPYNFALTSGSFYGVTPMEQFPS